MQWETQEMLRDGTCKISSKDESDLTGTYQLTRIYTGRSRLFWGYRLTVSVGGNEYIGNSRQNMISAVRQCGQLMREAGYGLQIMGMAKGFAESGLSVDSGYGYLAGSQVHMMDDCPC